MKGLNLHRAGIIINYDIPYNPTRVIQRVGRINRINKKVFDEIFIYNSFPTVVGEESTRIKTISTLKIKLINAVVGSDTKTLTSEEELQSFFKDEFDRAEEQNEKLSWDARHIENYENAKKEVEIMEKIENLPRRSRIQRVGQAKQGVLVFGKKGDNSVFTYGQNLGSVEIVSMETALPMFFSEKEETAIEVGDDFTEMFNYAKEKLFEKSELPKIQGRRAKSIEVLEVLGHEIPESKEFCDDVKILIKDYDGINEGALKDIAQLDLRDLGEAYKELKQIVPEEYKDSLFAKLEQTDKATELLLFAEQLT